MEVRAALGQVGQVVLTAILAWHMSQQCGQARGICCRPDRGLHGRRVLSMHVGSGLVHAKLWLGSEPRVDEICDHTPAILVRCGVVLL